MNSKQKRLVKYLLALLVTICAAVVAYVVLEEPNANVAVERYDQGRAFGEKNSAMACAKQSFVVPPSTCKNDAFCEVLHYSNYANGCLSVVQKRDEKDVTEFCKKGSKAFEEEVCRASGASQEACTAVKVGIASVCSKASK